MKKSRIKIFRPLYNQEGSFLPYIIMVGAIVSSTMYYVFESAARLSRFGNSELAIAGTSQLVENKLKALLSSPEVCSATFNNKRFSDEPVINNTIRLRGVEIDYSLNPNPWKPGVSIQSFGFGKIWGRGKSAVLVTQLEIKQKGAGYRAELVKLPVDYNTGNVIDDAPEKRSKFNMYVANPALPISANNPCSSVEMDGNQVFKDICGMFNGVISNANCQGIDVEGSDVDPTLLPALGAYGNIRIKQNPATGGGALDAQGNNANTEFGKLFYNSLQTPDLGTKNADFNSLTQINPAAGSTLNVYRGLIGTGIEAHLSTANWSGPGTIEANKVFVKNDPSNLSANNSNSNLAVSRDWVIDQWFGNLSESQVQDINDGLGDALVANLETTKAIYSELCKRIRYVDFQGTIVSAVWNGSDRCDLDFSSAHYPVTNYNTSDSSCGSSETVHRFIKQTNMGTPNNASTPRCVSGEP